MSDVREWTHWIVSKISFAKYPNLVPEGLFVFKNRRLTHLKSIQNKLDVLFTTHFNSTNMLNRKILQRIFEIFEQKDFTIKKWTHQRKMHPVCQNGPWGKFLRKKNGMRPLKVSIFPSISSLWSKLLKRNWKLFWVS